MIAVAAILGGFCVIAVVLLMGSISFDRSKEAAKKAAIAEQKENRVVTGDIVTIIGDSISVMTAEKMRAALPGVDIQAQNGKTADTDQEDNPSGLSIAKALLDNGGLRDIVVFALGSNNRKEVGMEPLSAETFKTLHDITGDRTVYLVTNVSVPQDQSLEINNRAMNAAVRKYDDWHVIDWAGTVEALPDPKAALSEIDERDWGIRLHPSDPAGIDLWVQLIVKALTGETPGT